MQMCRNPSKDGNEVASIYMLSETGSDYIVSASMCDLRIHLRFQKYRRMVVDNKNSHSVWSGNQNF